MNYNQQLEELQQRIDNTEDFLEKMEYLALKEELEIKLGVVQPPKPFKEEEGCGLSCGA